ncbi:MAG: sugar porter family MFS transporter [Acidobacteriaceae bacterium]
MHSHDARAGDIAGVASLSRIEKGPRLYPYLISSVAAISGILFGFDIAVINGAIVYLQDHYHLSPTETELAASSLLVGCVFGAAIGGWLSDRYGRRRILSLAALLFGFSSIAAALPRNIDQFEAARVVGGVGIGIASMLAPLYIAEVSPARIRGLLVSLNQMAIVSGILLAYLTNWLLSFLGPASWRWMFATAAVPSVLLFLGLLFVPESPRWLAEMGHENRALAILERIGGTGAGSRELADIKRAIATESGSWRELLLPQMRRPLLLGIGLAVFSQVTGINAVLFYGSLILEHQLGVHNRSSALGANVAIGIVNFLGTILALAAIDRVGRKPLLMISAGVMALCQITLGFAFSLTNPPALIIVCSMLICVAVFAIGLGPATWVLLSELFPTRIRGRAMSIANGSLWIACCALTASFLSLVKAFTISGAFWLYAVMCVLAFVLVWRVVPETKGKSLEEIEAIWKR